jgi:hypothetical protein
MAEERQDKKSLPFGLVLMLGMVGLAIVLIALKMFGL